VDPRFPEPRLRAEFRSELRARLMREAVTALAPRRRTSGWGLLRPAMGVGLAAFLLVAGAGTAAAGSLPGDSGFSLKKAIEDINVTFTFDDVQRVELLAQIADRRLHELQQVASVDDRKAATASEEFAAAVARFRAVADQVQTGASADKSSKVQQLVNTVRDAHSSLVQQIQDQSNDDAVRSALDRVRDTEDKHTTEEQNDPGRNGIEQKLRPARTPAAQQTPRPGATPKEGDDESDQGNNNAGPKATPKATPNRQSIIRTPTPSGRVHLDDPKND
jgi:gas vesicle protein